MSFSKCEACGSLILLSQAKCPHCGYPAGPLRTRIRASAREQEEMAAQLEVKRAKQARIRQYCRWSVFFLAWLMLVGGVIYGFYKYG